MPLWKAAKSLQVDPIAYLIELDWDPILLRYLIYQMKWRGETSTTGSEGLIFGVGHFQLCQDVNNYKFDLPDKHIILYNVLKKNSY